MYECVYVQMQSYYSVPERSYVLKDYVTTGNTCICMLS